MELEGEHNFEGPRDAVWELVRDPEVLASALPGTQSLEMVAENEYQGTMHVRIGPVSGVFAGRIVVSDEVPPESCTLSVEGRGAPGFASGAGTIQLTQLDDGTTLMAYRGDMQVGGRLASVGQRMLDTAGRSLIRQGLEALNDALRARAEAEETGQAVEYAPPSETRFAMAVASDMARELLPEVRTTAFVALIAAGTFLLGYLLGRLGRDQS